MKNYEDIAAVLFDLDGTLIEHTQKLEDLCLDTFKVFEEKLTPVTHAQFWETYWPKNRDLWYMMVDGALPGDVARLYSFVNTLRTLKADANLAQSMLEDWEGRIVDATRLLTDALPTIERMRRTGLRLGIVTNGFAAVQRRKLDRHRLEEQVDFILVSEEIGIFKPNRGIFEHALAQAGVTAGHALFVGDMPTSDIEGARNAGLRAALMDPRGIWTDPVLNGVPRLQRLSELLPLLGLE